MRSPTWRRARTQLTLTPQMESAADSLDDVVHLRGWHAHQEPTQPEWRARNFLRLPTAHWPTSGATQRPRKGIGLIISTLTCATDISPGYHGVALADSKFNWVSRRRVGALKQAEQFARSSPPVPATCTTSRPQKHCSGAEATHWRTGGKNANTTRASFEIYCAIFACLMAFCIGQK